MEIDHKIQQDKKLRNNKSISFQNFINRMEQKRRKSYLLWMRLWIVRLVLKWSDLFGKCVPTVKNVARIPWCWFFFLRSATKKNFFSCHCVGNLNVSNWSKTENKDRFWNVFIFSQSQFFCWTKYEYREFSLIYFFTYFSSSMRILLSKKFVIFVQFFGFNLNSFLMAEIISLFVGNKFFIQFWKPCFLYRLYDFFGFYFT